MAMTLKKCYEGIEEPSVPQWMRQTSTVTVVHALIRVAEKWFGLDWPHTLMILDGSVAERMEAARLAPDSADFFVKLG